MMESLTSGLASIDPHAWMVTLPVLAAMVAMALLPDHATPKRWWQELMRAETAAWAQVCGGESDEAPRPAWHHGLLCAATTALALGTLLSMACYAGVVG